MKCTDCKHNLAENWLFCPFCGHKVSVAPTQASISSQGSRPGTYGTGVRAQILELTVRQALTGANWKESCAKVMQANHITVEEVEHEVQKRLALHPHPPGLYTT